jgi:hypothetical protein
MKYPRRLIEDPADPCARNPFVKRLRAYCSRLSSGPTLLLFRSMVATDTKLGTFSSLQALL